MRRRWNRSLIWTVLVLVAAVGLVGLAIAQYRWISEISEGERQRRRSDLERSAVRLAFDIGGTVAQLARALTLPDGPSALQVSASSPETRIRARLAVLRQLGADEDLIQAIYLSEPPPPGSTGAPTLRVWNNGKLESAPTSPVLTADPVDGPFAFRPDGGIFLVVPLLTRRQRAVPEAFVLREPPPGDAGHRPDPPKPKPPREPHGDESGNPRFGRGRRGSPWGRGLLPIAPLPPLVDVQESRLIVVLNRQHLESKVVPAAVQRHFQTGSLADFAVQLLDHRGKKVYESEPMDASARFDVTVPLLAGKSWTLQARLRAGQLEQRLQETRRHNLAISFGILILIGVVLSALLWANRQASRLAEQQLEFVASVTHELRTPLAVIRSAADNLADGVVRDGGQIQRYGSLIAKEGRRLTGMVEQILGFAALERGSNGFEREKVHAADLLAEGHRAARPEVEQARCEVTVEAEEGLPQVQVDRQGMVQVLRNLIANAAVHGGSGGWIRIAARTDGSWLKLEVEDRGPGLGPGEKQRVFRAFERGKRAREEQVHGFGLGLALARRIVEQHGGTIEVADAQPSGARFVVRLPIEGQDRVR
jgi:signal transduction histidine kinase